MKQYLVRLPITGVVEVYVEAESEDDAIDNALETDITIDDIVEWDICRQIVQGNVFHGRMNAAEVVNGEED
jgi:hypothetical protein